MAKQDATINLDDLELTPHVNPDADQPEESAAAPATVKVKRDDGKYKRRESFASLGLSKEMLPPITKRKTAIYEAIGLHMIDPLTKEPVMDQSIMIPGSFTIFDPFEPDYAKKNKRLRNVTGTYIEVVQGKNEIREKVDDIFFVNGYLDVNIEKEYPLYALLELHPLNATNQFRDKSKSAAFRRIDMNYKSTDVKNATMDLQYDAENAVIRMDMEDLKAYATSAGITTMNREIKEIRYDFRVFARNNPKVFFGLVKNTEAAIKMNVIDADNMGLIEHVPEKKGYIFTSDPERCFMVHAVGEEPMPALIAYFNKKTDAQAQENYKYMLSQLKFWEE